MEIMINIDAAHSSKSAYDDDDASHLNRTLEGEWI